MLRIISASLALTPKDIFHLTPLITPITYKAFPPKLPWHNSPQVSSDLSDLFISLLYSCTLLHSTLKILQLLQSQPSSFGPHSTLPPWVTASISTSSVTSWKSLEFHILIPVFIATNLKWSEVAQLCLTLCDPMDYSLQSSSAHGIFQARVLECGLPFPSPGDLPDQGIEPRSPALQADTLLSEPPGKPCHQSTTFYIFIFSYSWRPSLNSLSMSFPASL